MKEFFVKKEHEKLRLDKAVAVQYKDLSRTNIQKLIDDEKILVNNKIAKSSYKVEIGDKICVEEVKAKEISLQAQDIPLEIIYEDNDIIVVNKPKGMVVHPACGNLDRNISKCNNGNMQEFFIWNRWRNKATE